MTEPVLVQREANTVTLLLNRPERRNALSHALLVALSHALTSRISADAGAVIITGAGNCFSAGADYTELTGTIADLAIDEDIAKVTDNIKALPIPVTAAVNGPCLGGAVDLALSCAQRVASQNAYFQVPATCLGLLYNPASVHRMVLRYGRDIVFRLLVMGECFDAHAALAVGMVSSVTGNGGTCDRAQMPAINSQDKLDPVAAATKDMIDAIDRGDFDQEYWEQVRREILSSNERFEAVAGFKSRMQSKDG